ncbi:hypothetical protein Pelo_14256 [Pelomyxa schiedti]|nr:hypothetical protein Pelo_14256 [Pelomyxa schiedti]
MDCEASTATSTTSTSVPQTASQPSPTQVVSTAAQQEQKQTPQCPCVTCACACHRHNHWAAPGCDAATDTDDLPADEDEDEYEGDGADTEQEQQHARGGDDYDAGLMTATTTTTSGRGCCVGCGVLGWLSSALGGLWSPDPPLSTAAAARHGIMGDGPAASSAGASSQQMRKNHNRPQAAVKMQVRKPPANKPRRMNKETTTAKAQVANSASAAGDYGKTSAGVPTRATTKVPGSAAALGTSGKSVTGSGEVDLLRTLPRSPVVPIKYSDLVAKYAGEEADETYMIPVMGDLHVGKTSFLHCVKHGKTPLLVDTEHDVEQTVPVVEFYHGKKLKLMLIKRRHDWFLKIPARSVFGIAHSFLIIFDITHRQSWDHAKSVIEDIRKYHKNPMVPWVLLANKTDLEEQRAVPKTEIEEFMLPNKQGALIESSKYDLQQTKNTLQLLLSQVARQS